MIPFYQAFCLSCVWKSFQHATLRHAEQEAERHEVNYHHGNLTTEIR